MLLRRLLLGRLLGVRLGRFFARFSPPLAIRGGHAGRGGVGRRGIAGRRLGRPVRGLRPRERSGVREVRRRGNRFLGLDGAVLFLVLALPPSSLLGVGGPPPLMLFLKLLLLSLLLLRRAKRGANERAFIALETEKRSAAAVLPRFLTCCCCSCCCSCCCGCCSCCEFVEEYDPALVALSDLGTATLISTSFPLMICTLFCMTRSTLFPCEEKVSE